MLEAEAMRPEVTVPMELCPWGSDELRSWWAQGWRYAVLHPCEKDQPKLRGVKVRLYRDAFLSGYHYQKAREL